MAPFSYLLRHFVCYSAILLSLQDLCSSCLSWRYLWLCLPNLQTIWKCICSKLILCRPRVQRTTIDKGGKAQRKHCCRLSHSSKFASCASSNRDFSKVLNFCAKLKGCALQLFLFSELSIFLRNARNWIC